MAEITAQMVKELRERTQAGMSDCKNALVEALGDMEKAVDVILKKGLVKAAKTAGKVASEGEVRTFISADKKRGTVVEVNCQTDFVARGEDFKKFVGVVLEVATGLAPGSDILAAKVNGSGSGGETVEAARLALAGKIGENIVVRRWDAVEAKTGFVQDYVHMGGKNASLVALETSRSNDALVREFADHVAMQIVAMRPMVVGKHEITQNQVNKQREIFESQLKEEKKPEASWPKILEGKMSRWFSEVTLLGQDNVWGELDGANIETVRAALSKKIGDDISIGGFVRFELGEGIQKKSEDLAAEVAKTIGS